MHDELEREGVQPDVQTHEQPVRRVQTIELDCPPGSMRPGDLIEGVIAGTGLSVREPIAMIFGEWTWDYGDVPADEWAKMKPTLKERITALYYDGFIRYGSW